ncbi:calcium dependent protein kinase [Reticulomyxa filosa]|uniref:Calcium dependent protein kinase n=1 Tax=Reticulomyxa filosa TaxID=46433 RepID=X6MRS9_RETFI|nr:calcium dependent protein kinase [Reticulomyxa filosa]|eukprot:ETO16514.1 calcium dependent protein kinase [Reticulomyxa filosa]
MIYSVTFVLIIFLKKHNNSNKKKNKSKGVEANTRNARWIIRSLLNTVKHLHERNIAHRDIKPENVVIFEREHLALQAKALQGQQEQMKEKNEEQKSWKAEKERQKPRGKRIEVKLIDFGNAVSGDNWHKSNEMVGTLNYMSPERYNPAQQQLWHEWSGDMWSIGVVTFELLFQQRLFELDQEVHALKAQICQGLWSFPTTNQSQLSMSDLEWLAAKHFINHLLVIDPKQRTTAAYALKHPWLCRSNKTNSIKQLRHRMHLWEKRITTYAPSSKKY